MEAATAGEPRRFDHLREHSIGLPQVLFQSITHMAPAAAVAYSIYISVPDARQALPLSVGLAGNCATVLPELLERLHERRPAQIADHDPRARSERRLHFRRDEEPALDVLDALELEPFLPPGEKARERTDARER